MSIQELHENGTMNFLVKKGFITPSAYRKIEIFVEVKALEFKGIIRSHAVEQVAKKCRVCESTVWKSLHIVSSL